MFNYTVKPLLMVTFPQHGLLFFPGRQSIHVHVFTLMLTILQRPPLYTNNSNLSVSTQRSIFVTIGQSGMTFGGHIVINFVAWVASLFCAQVEHRVQMMVQGTQINYMHDKSCVYHYYQYTKPNRTNLFHKERLSTWNHVAGCKFHLQPARCRLACEKEHIFREGSLSFGCV